MPDLRNEAPTDGELRAYLDEWLDQSSISLLLGSPGNKELYHPEVAEALAFLSSSPVCSRFLESATKTLFASLQRLNRLRRDDSFWINTNRRPTVPKLGCFGEKILKEDPNDILSLLTLVLLKIAHAGEFEVMHWVQLYRLNAVDLEYVTFAALMLEVAGSPCAEEFADFLRHTANTTTAEVLPVLHKDAGRILSQWRSRVIAAACRI